MPNFGDLVERAGELGVRIAVAGAVMVVFAVAGRITSPLVRGLLDRRRPPSYTRVFGALYRVGVVLVGCLFALTLALPSVRVADVLAIFGIVSVAAGFAFKETFENLLAGVLLLLRDPFKSVDQVTLAGRDGTVEGVTVRETLVRGHDGRHYFIPNAKVMTDVIDVATHNPSIRESFRLRVPGDADLDLVRRVVTDALASAAAVRADPPPEAVLVDVLDGDVAVECRFWCGSRRSEATAATDAAIAAVFRALRRRGVPLPIDDLRIHVADGTATDGPDEAEHR